MKSTSNSVRGKLFRSFDFWRRPLVAPHREVRPGLWGEQLEARAMLAGDTSADVQITAEMLAKCDVDADGTLAPRDALMLVNDLNAFGARALGDDPAVALASDSLTPLGAAADINGDQQVSPSDALMVLNALATADANDKVRVRLQVVDAQGNQLASVKVGDTFFVRAYVQDIRATATGAFAVYTDIAYQADFAKVNGAITYSADYTSGKAGTTTTAGLVDEAGAFAGLTPTGADEKLVFTVPFTATAAGTLTFAPDPADTKPAHDILLYGTNTAVLNDEVEFVSASIQVTAETPPNITIADVSAAEGNAAGEMKFTVTLSAASSGQVTVNYATQDGTAVDGQDYTSSTGTLTFAPGETSKTITVPILGDGQAEPDETFRVLLSGAAGGNITDAEAVGTITNDDGAPPTLSVEDVTVRETSPGNTTMLFIVKLSQASTLPVTVTYATPGITATAGSDYTSLNGSLTIPAGQTSRQVAIQILSDDIPEGTETFGFNLSNALNAVIGDGEAIGAILDNDQEVRVNIANKASVNEGDTGNTDAVVQVTLSQAATADVVIKYHTEDNTAKAGTDYVAQAAGQIVIAAGQTTGEIRVPVIGNTTAQANRSFRIRLDDAGIAGLDSTIANVTIVDDDLGISIGNAVSVIEGNDGTVSLIYTVSLSKASTETVTVNFATADGTATAGADYVAQSGTLTFAPGETSKTVTVVVNGDTVDEADETVLVNLTAPTGGYGLVDAQGTGTITDDDGPALPTISITNTPTVTEGDSGTVELVFTITLSAASTTAVTVQYASQDGNAGGPDYQPTSGTLTFAPGETTKEVKILVNGDTLDENNESVALNLSNATGATIATPQGLGFILDDDPQVSASISDAQIVEGNSGTTVLEFTVSLSKASGLPITFNYATADGTATAGSDYVAATGTVSFAPGETSKKIQVTINGDTTVEPTETFLVNLSGTTFASIADGQATGTITDDDGVPTISIADQSISEGNSGTKVLEFTVTLSSAATGNVTVNYATADGSAIAGNDYVAKTGTVTFAAGETSKKIQVTINGDTVVEGDETFLVNLTNPTGATIADAQATGTITNDDSVLPTLNISNPTVAEGNSGTTKLSFVVTLSAAQTTAVTVDFATGNGTATAGSDYVTQTGTITFAPGQTSKTIEIVVSGDTTVEPNETVLVILSNAQGATIADGQGEGTITNDDTGNQATLSINDVSVSEGNSGEVDMKFTVTLSAAQTGPVTVQYSTVEDTAQVELDYVGASGTLTFAAGETTKEIIVKIKGDTLAEGNERLFVRLFGATGATIADAEGVGTIQDDNDDALTITIDDVSQNEGDNNTATQFVFTVRLSRASDQAVSVHYSTADISALSTSGDTQDYQSQPDTTLTFAAGETVKQFTVLVRGDARYEINEQFAVNLSSPTGAELGRTKALGTILNDDAQPTVSIGDVVVNEFTGKGSEATFTVFLSRSSGVDTKVFYSTADGTATAGQDYTSKNDFVIVPAGQTSVTFTVSILNDSTANEPEETFFVNLANPSNATIGDGQAVGTIRDVGADGTKDARYSIRITDANGQPINTLIPGQSFFLEVYVEDLRAMPIGTESAYADVLFNNNLVSVNGAIVYNPAYNLGQAGDTATTAGLIDEAGAVSLTSLGPRPVMVFKVPMKAGSTTGTVNFTINGADATEHFTVMSGTNLALLQDELDFVGASLQIANVPTVSIADQQIVEGNSGTKEMVFTLTLSAASTTAISVTASTAPNSASSGIDFVPKSGETITFAPGETTKTFTVVINGDTLDEGASETFFVNLTAVGTAAISDGQATGTITDDDNPPTISVADATVVEGNSGQSNLAFVITLSAPSSLPVTVTYTTTAGTATAGTDFESISSTVTIQPGQTSATVNVRVIGDAIFEPNETLTFTLSNPTNATLADGTATGTITNDDTEAATPGRIAGTVFLDTNRSGGMESNEKGLAGVTVRITGATLTGLTVNQSRTTDANGAFAFENIAPGNYQLIETQPGFYSDGVEVAGAAGNKGSSVNDTFSIGLTSSMNANNYLFAEAGLRPEFVSKRNSIASLTAQDILNTVVSTSSGFWYSLDGGVASLKAAASTAKGSVSLELYDANLNKLASSASGSSAELNYETSADQTYFLKVGGTSKDATLRVSADVVQDGDTVTVQGSSGDDVIEFTAGDTLRITVNGQTHEYDRATVNRVVVNGNGGNDQAMLVGSSGNENVNLTRGFATIDGAGYSVAVNNVAQIRVNGGGGVDSVSLHDSVFNDQFNASGNLMTLQRDGDYYLAAWGFEMAKVTTLASATDSDTKEVGAIDFALAFDGDWS